MQSKFWPKEKRQNCYNSCRELLSLTRLDCKMMHCVLFQLNVCALLSIFHAKSIIVLRGHYFLQMCVLSSKPFLSLAAHYTPIINPLTFSIGALTPHSHVSLKVCFLIDLY